MEAIKKKAETFLTGLAGFFGIDLAGIFFNNVRFFGMDEFALKDVIEGICQISIALVTIYFTIKRNRKQNENNTSDFTDTSNELQGSKKTGNNRNKRKNRNT